jgi:ADP-glucose pyrophosphorylase
VHIGHHVIPNALAQEMKLYAYQHDGYWHVSSSVGGAHLLR